jgi:hypothetical protein
MTMILTDETFTCDDIEIDEAEEDGRIPLTLVDLA